MAARSTGRLERRHVLTFSTPVGLGLLAATLVALGVLATIVLTSLGLGPDPAGDSTPIAPATESSTVQPSSSPMATATQTPPPTTTPTPTASPQPTAVPGAWSGLVWSEPVTPPMAINLVDVQPWADAYVAVGTVGGGDSAFFASPDGLNWSVTFRLDDPLDRPPRQLVVLDDELLAFAAGPNAVPLVWRSTDGATWTPVTSPSWEAAWSDRTFFSAASGPNGIVAIGNATAGEHHELFADPVVLRSVDGFAWTRTGLSGASDRSVVWDIIGFEGGYAILGGAQTGLAVGSGPPEAWWSTDGLAWAKASMAGATADDSHFERGSGLSSDGGLIAQTQLLSVGAPPALRAWVSADGRTWSRATDVGVDLPFAVLSSDGARIVALATTEGWTPLGDDPDPYPGFTRAWVSTDAVTWQPLELSHAMTDQLEQWWVVPDGIVYAGVRSFWFGTPVAR
jgi:hypothetical protein